MKQKAEHIEPKLIRFISMEDYNIAQELAKMRTNDKGARATRKKLGLISFIGHKGREYPTLLDAVEAENNN